MKNKKILLIVGGAIIVAVVVFLVFNVFLPQQEKPKETPISLPSKKETVATTDISIIQTVQHYDSENLRDPFAPLIIKRQVTQKGVSPLESYDVEELKVSGIVLDKKGSYALIQTPDGKFYIAKEKDKIGISGSMITKIGKDFIEIKETPAYGGISPKTKQLKLRMEEEQ